MVLSLQDQLSDYIAKKTINVYVFGFFTLWTHYAIKVIPKEMCIQIMTYLNSPELCAIVSRHRNSDTQNLAKQDALLY
jgi:hypothetical protein